MAWIGMKVKVDLINVMQLATDGYLTCQPSIFFWIISTKY